MQSIEELEIKLKWEMGRWEETLFGWFCDFARQVAVARGDGPNSRVSAEIRRRELSP